MLQVHVLLNLLIYLLISASHRATASTGNILTPCSPNTACAISTDIIRQTIVQHCHAPDLELTATCCVKLRLSLYFQSLYFQIQT